MSDKISYSNRMINLTSTEASVHCNLCDDNGINVNEKDTNIIY